MRLAAALWMLTLPAMGAMQPVREVNSQAFLTTGQLIPCFYEGYLYYVDLAPRNHFELYAPDGHFLFDRYIQPDLAAGVLSVAVDSNGTVAVSWYDSYRGRAGIDLLDAAGRPLSSFDTGLYLPSHLAFAADHSIWSFGWQRIPTNRGIPASSYMTLRHYSSDGKQMGAYLPRSLFPQGLQPACSSWQERGIYLANDRIGLLACSGQTSVNPEWVEVDFNGNLIGRWRVGRTDQRRVVGLASDGHVYAQETTYRPDLKALFGQMFLLDRTAGSFQPLSWTVAGFFYGADGDQLVFVPFGVSGPIRLDWYGQP
jgi:hypothetical protein